jgi:hypothetical protein
MAAASRNPVKARCIVIPMARPNSAVDTRSTMSPRTVAGEGRAYGGFHSLR